VANNMTGTLRDMTFAFMAGTSPTHGFHAGPALLVQLDGFIVSSPKNSELLLAGAEMNCSYALTFLDSTDPEWARHLYEKGRGYAMRGLGEVNGEILDAIGSGDAARLAREVAELDDEEQPLVFWTALCWGGIINATQDAVMAADLPLVEVLIAASLEKNPTYYFAAGHTFFGMLNAGRSEMLGGDLEKGRAAFERSMELTGGRFLLTKVMFARTYAVNKQDPALYVKTLNEVLEASFEDPPEMRLANAVARRDAARLLERTRDYFPGFRGDTGLEPEAGLLEEEEADDLDLD